MSPFASALSPGGSPGDSENLVSASARSVALLSAFSHAVLRPSSEPEPGGPGQSSRSWQRLRRSCRRKPSPSEAPRSPRPTPWRYFYTKNITDHCCPDPRTMAPELSHGLFSPSPSSHGPIPKSSRSNLDLANKRLEASSGQSSSPGRVGTRHDPIGRRRAFLRPGEGAQESLRNC